MLARFIYYIVTRNSSSHLLTLWPSAVKAVFYIDMRTLGQTVTHCQSLNTQVHNEEAKTGLVNFGMVYEIVENLNIYFSSRHHLLGTIGMPAMSFKVVHSRMASCYFMQDSSV
jgi:hypothetical protein